MTKLVNRATSTDSSGNASATASFTDGAGVLGAIVAALCCAGTPFIVSALAAVGLSFLRSDAILLPLMGVSLVIAFWGFWQGRRLHGSVGPLALAVAGAAGLVTGVVFIHGFPAKQVIWSGAVALLVATVWNVAARRRCATRSAASISGPGRPRTGR